MNDFKVIPQAPDYKINKDQEIRRVSNDKPLFLIGQKALLKKPDGTMQHFMVDELVAQVFAEENPLSGNSTTHTQAENKLAASTTTEIQAEENNTNESEDKKLVNDVASEIITTSDVTAVVKKGRGRPKKIQDPNAPIKVKVKGKRGRPAGSKNKTK